MRDLKDDLRVVAETGDVARLCRDACDETERLRKALALAWSMILGREPVSPKAEQIIESALKGDPPTCTTTMREELERQHKRVQALEKVVKIADEFNNVFEEITGWYIQPESVNDLMFTPTVDECKKLLSLQYKMANALRDLEYVDEQIK